VKAVDNELHVRHLTVDEALFRLDQYLNDAFMANLPSVRIVHGKGMGDIAPGSARSVR
jgi:DNA mismatch repair protein MutS2